MRVLIGGDGDVREERARIRVANGGGVGFRMGRTGAAPHFTSITITLSAEEIKDALVCIVDRGLERRPVGPRRMSSGMIRLREIQKAQRRESRLGPRPRPAKGP